MTYPTSTEAYVGATSSVLFWTEADGHRHIAIPPTAVDIDADPRFQIPALALLEGCRRKLQRGRQPIVQGDARRWNVDPKPFARLLREFGELINP